MPEPLHTFLLTAGLVSGLCVGIIILTLFFSLVAYLKSKLSKEKVGKMESYIRDGNFVDVHLANGNTLQRMKFIGFTSRATVKGHVPFQLGNMVVLENEQGLRTLIRADSIKMIQEIV
jgi:hypothetical protein